MTSEASFKELIPEFFAMPELLTNVNAVDLGVRQNGDRVNDVLLPAWARGSPERFIAIHRLALESEHVSSSLHLWIDLIFGCKQRGPAAVAAKNVFHPLTYEGSVDWTSIVDPRLRESIISQIVNFGTTPAQIFDRSHPARFTEAHCIERRALKCAVNDFGTKILLTPLSLLSSAAMGSAHLKKTVIGAPRKFAGEVAHVLGAAADAGRATLAGSSSSSSHHHHISSSSSSEVVVVPLPGGQGAVWMWFDEEHWQGSRMWVLQQDGSTCGIWYRPYSHHASSQQPAGGGGGGSKDRVSSSPSVGEEEDVLEVDDHSLVASSSALPGLFRCNLRNRVVLLPSPASSAGGRTGSWKDDSLVVVNEWDGAVRTRAFDCGEIRQQVLPSEGNEGGIHATAISKAIDGNERTLVAIGYENGSVKIFETTLNSPKQGHLRRVLETVGSAIRFSDKTSSAPMLSSPHPSPRLIPQVISYLVS